MGGLWLSVTHGNLPNCEDWGYFITSVWQTIHWKGNSVMAKKKSPVSSSRGKSKAQAIRDEFAAQGAAARPKDVIAALKAKGMKVASAQVSNIKAKLGSGKAKRGRKPGAAHSAHSANGMVSLEVLLEAKKLAERLGGVDAARKALEALSKLT